VYANGTNIAVVEIEPETGHTRVVDYFVAHDCGRIINPVLVDVTGATSWNRHPRGARAPCPRRAFSHL
jgi:hypothetical protein